MIVDNFREIFYFVQLKRKPLSKFLSQADFKDTFEAYYSSIRNFIYYKSGDMDLAEDLAQETFMKLWEKRQEINPETVKSYLYTIANNMALNHFKHQKVVLKFQNQALSQSPVTGNSPHYELEHKEFNERLQQAINDLPDKLRVAFLMNRVDKMKHQQIADALQLSVKGVQKRVRKALDLINEKIKYRI